MESPTPPSPPVPEGRVAREHCQLVGWSPFHAPTSRGTFLLPDGPTFIPCPCVLTDALLWTCLSEVPSWSTDLIPPVLHTVSLPRVSFSSSSGSSPDHTNLLLFFIIFKIFLLTLLPNSLFHSLFPVKLPERVPCLQGSLNFPFPCECLSLRGNIHWESKPSLSGSSPQLLLSRS